MQLNLKRILYGHEVEEELAGIGSCVWGHVPQKPVRSLWLPFDLVAENTLYKLTGNVLRP